MKKIKWWTRVQEYATLHIVCILLRFHSDERLNKSTQNHTGTYWMNSTIHTSNETNSTLRLYNLINILFIQSAIVLCACVHLCGFIFHLFIYYVECKYILVGLYIWTLGKCVRCEEWFNTKRGDTVLMWNAHLSKNVNGIQ